PESRGHFACQGDIRTSQCAITLDLRVTHGTDSRLSVRLASDKSRSRTASTALVTCAITALVAAY
ncbi:hypothetical protein, partial [Streptomyces spongiae]|uniref:hypothetical protein n=1 Tax=Streptomyces spongiae TaxID=565072 RepID=UPI001D15370C